MAKKSGGKAATKRTAAKTKKRVSAKPAAKPAAKTAAVPAIRVRPRRLKPPKYKSFRLHKRVKHPVKLPNIWRLAKKAGLTLWENKELFAGITLIYGLLTLVLAQGLSAGSDLSTLKHTLDQVFTGHFGAFISGVSVFVLLIGSAGNSSSPTAGAYQLFIALIASLALIWAFRQVLAGKTVRIRDAFYRGMYPLVPFVLVLLVIGLQLVPMLIGSTLYSLVISNGIAIYFVEKLVWAVLYGVLTLLSLYLVTSSIFALYIVTLPDMTPMKALRSARELVRYRRWTVLRKILALPLILLIIAAIVMLPIIVWLTPLAQWAFFLLTMLSLTAVHSYMYTLYRELLND